MLSLSNLQELPNHYRVKVEILGEIGDPERGVQSYQKGKNKILNLVGERSRHLHVIYDVPGWAYWFKGENLAKFAPSNWRVTRSSDLPRRFEEDPPDVVLLLNYSGVERVRRQLERSAPTVILVGSMNVGWPRRKEFLLRMRDRCDHTIINNLDMYLKSGALPGTSTISNGVDLEVFKVDPGNSVIKRKPRVLWLGSTYHAALKGHGIMRTLKPRLENLGFSVSLKLVNSHGKKMTHAEMVNWYQSGTIFVVAAESEGTPNPALEAAACGLGLVATRVGNMPELIEDRVNGVLVGRNAREILEGILYTQENLLRLTTNLTQTIKSWSWEIRAETYFELFEMLLRGQTPNKTWNIPSSFRVEDEKGQDIEFLRSQINPITVPVG